MAVASSIFVPRPPAQLEVPMNFDAISKNVKILQFGPVEPKLWNFCEKLVKSPWGRKNPFPPACHAGGNGFFLPHGDLTSFSGNN